MKKLKILQELLYVTQRYKLSKCCWENGANRLDGCRVTTNLQSLKKKEKCNLRSTIKQSVIKRLCLYLQNVPNYMIYQKPMSLSFF